MGLKRNVVVSGAEPTVSSFLAAVAEGPSGGTVDLRDAADDSARVTVSFSAQGRTTSIGASNDAAVQLILVESTPSQDILRSLPLSTPSIVAVLDSEADTKQLNSMNTSALPLFYGFCSVGTVGAGSDPTEYVPVLKRLREVLMYPVHLLWNSATNSLTERGQQAFLRAFWLLDADGDGVLTGDEEAQWFEWMYPGFKIEYPRIAAQLNQQGEGYTATSPTSEEGGSEQKGGCITHSGFLALAHILLLKGCVRELWQLLNHAGTQPTTSFPFPEEPTAQLHRGGKLSRIAESFLTSAFNRSACIQLARFSPDTPWGKEVGGLVPLEKQTPGVTETGSSLLMTVEDFLRAWRWVASDSPAQVGLFCRHWGFKGDLATLVEASPTKKVLVLGSPGCGKSSLLHRMSGHSLDESKHRFGGGSEVQVLLKDGLMFVEPTEKGADEWLQSTPQLSELSAVLLLLDGSDSYSFSYLMGKHQQLVKGLAQLGKTTNDVPCILLLTKADLPTAAPIASVAPQDYCRDSDLLWPPIVTSVVEEDLMGLKNEVEAVVDMLQDVLASPDVASTAAVRKPTTSLVPIVLAVAAAFTVGMIVFRRRK